MNILIKKHQMIWKTLKGDFIAVIVMKSIIPQCSIIDIWSTTMKRLSMYRLYVPKSSWRVCNHVKRQQKIDYYKKPSIHYDSRFGHWKFWKCLFYEFVKFPWYDVSRTLLAKIIKANKNIINNIAKAQLSNFKRNGSYNM